MNQHSVMKGPWSRVPLVSVITPVYNGEVWLGEALDSALGQTFESLEIIVVDDGSSDSSLQVAHDRAQRASGRITVISQNNAGLPTARNVAMNHAQGQYYALLDADDAWQPDHLEMLMALFDRDPDLGLVHANIERVDAGGRTLGIPNRNWSTQSDAFDALALRHEHVSCPTAVFSRSAIEIVGGFDPLFTGLGCEDRDLWLRIAARFRIRYLDRVTARYRVHQASMSADRNRMARARQQLIVKLGQTSRGFMLVPRMEAMLLSDLGLELLDDDQYGAAILHQWRALRLTPAEPVVQRRLIRSLLEGCRALTGSRRWHADQGGVS